MNGELLRRIDELIIVLLFAASTILTLNPCCLPASSLPIHSSASIVAIFYSPSTPHHSPFTTHYSLLTTHYSLTAHYSLLTTHYSLHTTHYLLLTIHCLLLATHYLLLTNYCTLPTAHHRSIGRLTGRYAVTPVSSILLSEAEVKLQRWLDSPIFARNPTGVCHSPPSRSPGTWRLRPRPSSGAETVMASAQTRQCRPSRCSCSSATRHRNFPTPTCYSQLTTDYLWLTAYNLVLTAYY